MQQEWLGEDDIILKRNTSVRAIGISHRGRRTSALKVILLKISLTEAATIRPDGGRISAGRPAIDSISVWRQ
jgi:hypothetical protein